MDVILKEPMSKRMNKGKKERSIGKNQGVNKLMNERLREKTMSVNVRMIQ